MSTTLRSLAFFLFIFSSGCATTRQSSQSIQPEDATVVELGDELEPVGKASGDVPDVRLPKKISGLYQKNSLLLGPEDVLTIKIADHPELNANVIVDPWGFIKLPYIQEFRVQGLTVDVVREILTQKYSEFFVKAPAVEVSVEQYNSQVVYILGAVGAEGRYPLVKGKPMTLRDAITAAGLTTPRAAQWRVWVIRQTDTGPVFQHINLYKIMYRGQLKNNVPLAAGDIVYVPMTILDTFVTFIGRVVSPIFGSSARALAVGAPTP